MTPEKQQALDEHIRAIAKILHEDTPPEELNNLAAIEQAVRNQVQKHVAPKIGFFIETETGTTAGYPRTIKSIIGELTITSKQAEKLEVKNNTQISPCLEACCLRISANVSYERAEEDIEYLTGIHVSKSTQQRLVHRSEFVLPESTEPVSELSVDGGNIRIRTELGEPCKWKGYKATCLHDQREADNYLE